LLVSLKLAFKKVNKSRIFDFWTVGAVYDRAYFVEPSKDARS